MSTNEMSITGTSMRTSNIAYFKTIPGILKVLQMVISIIIVGVTGFAMQIILGDYPKWVYTLLYLLLIATTALVATFCLLLSYLASKATGTITAKTIFEVLHQFSIALLYTTCGLALLVFLTIELTESDRDHWEFKILIAAAIMK
ncbi:hypothetical protein QYM36_003110 [Artemia franciscana]|uniref:MARVEL domain-containing protein n=1 Tax=Artemia franciscana TaxID=6661 RepID=A0AA88LFR1_ARTSF|nr:hypothetical protein QYM36_003110 [Artemia franciscana]